MKDALVEEFSLTDLGCHEVRGMGKMRLMNLSSVIERALERKPRFN
jgi:hypothetical protein